MAGRIQREDGSLVEPDRIGELTPTNTVNGEAWVARAGDIMLGPAVPAVRGGGRAGFEFSSPRNTACDRLKVRFTDDAGLHWELDHELHLVRLDDRDAW
jgi:hypothetical protein